jgi:protein TonB
VILLLVVGYIALLYGIAHTRAAKSGANGVPMFGPVISRVGQRRGDALAARPAAGSAEDDSLAPARHWIFSPIDIWPTAPGSAPPASEFTPVSDAEADPRDIQPPAPNAQPAKEPRQNRSTLRMVRWMRPEYPTDWALAGKQGSVVLDLLIGPDGKPVHIAVAQGSGSEELDQAVLSAANFWEFAPPRWKSRPVEVWGRLEVRFHPRQARLTQ